MVSGSPDIERTLRMVSESMVTELRIGMWTDVLTKVDGASVLLAGNPSGAFFIPMTCTVVSYVICLTFVGLIGAQHHSLTDARRNVPDHARNPALTPCSR